MRARFLLKLSLVLGVSVQSALAIAECDCTKFPFKPNPPCEDQCFARVLNYSPTGSLKSMFGFSEDLTKKIDAIRSQSNKPLSWQAFQSKFTASEFKTVREGLSELNDGKVAVLNSSMGSDGSKQYVQQEFKPKVFESPKDKKLIDNQKPITPEKQP